MEDFLFASLDIAGPSEFNSSMEDRMEDWSSPFRAPRHFRNNAKECSAMEDALGRLDHAQSRLADRSFRRSSVRRQFHRSRQRRLRRAGHERSTRLTPTMFGWGCGHFLCRLLSLEVPSNIVLHRYRSPHLDRPRDVTWGIISMSTACRHRSEKLLCRAPFCSASLKLDSFPA